MQHIELSTNDFLVKFINFLNGEKNNEYCLTDTLRIIKNDIRDTCSMKWYVIKKILGLLAIQTMVTTLAAWLFSGWAIIGYVLVVSGIFISQEAIDNTFYQMAVGLAYSAVILAGVLSIVFAVWISGYLFFKKARNKIHFEDTSVGKTYYAWKDKLCRRYV